MAFLKILVLMVNCLVIHGRTEVGLEESHRTADSHNHFDVYASAIAKAHYNPWYCNYFREPGYKCTDCGTALHCYPGNFALLIQCSGGQPYCNNGYCSAEKVKRCTESSSKIKLLATEQKESNNESTINVESKAENILMSTINAHGERERRRHY